MPYQEQMGPAKTTVDQLFDSMSKLLSERAPVVQVGSVDAQSGYAVNQLTAQAKVQSKELEKFMEETFAQSMARVEEKIFFGTNLGPVPPSDPLLGVDVRGT